MKLLLEDTDDKPVIELTLQEFSKNVSPNTISRV